MQIIVTAFLLLALLWAVWRAGASARGALPQISQNHTLNVLAWFGLFFMVPGALLFLMAVWQLLMLVVSYPTPGSDGSDVRWHSSIMLALLAAVGAIVGLVFAFIRVLTTERQTRTAEAQATHNENVLFNEKITEATRDLYAQRQVTKDPDTKEGAYDIREDDLIRRNAAIDQLERLAGERPETAGGIARMLSVYVRELSKAHEADPVPEGMSPGDLEKWARDLKVKRSDMEKAVQTLGRLRAIAARAGADLPIDLREANLQGMTLTGLDFEGADLRGAQLQGADLREAKLQGANLVRAQLQGARLWNAQLQRANLGGAQLQGADLRAAAMDEETDLRSASLRGARLRYVDYTQVGLTQEQVDSVFGDDTVALPEGITPPERFSRAHEGREAFEAAWRAWQTEIGFDRDDPSTWGQ